MLALFDTTSLQVFDMIIVASTVQGALDSALAVCDVSGYMAGQPIEV